MPTWGEPNRVLDAREKRVSEQPYKQPPITEAVIEIRFAAPLGADRIAAISGDFQSLYPFEQRIADVHVQLNLPSAPQAGTTTETIETLGHKRSSLDQTEILVLRPQNFVVSQLAPYPGWQTFFERFRRDWILWKSLISYRKISRIGVRYINRIDIPSISGQIINYEQYINIYPHLPTLIPNVQGYGVQVIVDMPDISCRMTLNSLTAPSPLLGHGGFIIDQDIYNEQTPPQNDDDIYTFLNVVRVKKNDVFEACITSRARELFKPWQD
jgi:uncharacterized protein (TIGR04255 family)